ncbi:isopeptide-forming domain-containing fimbrial protein [Companilactobacillus paralimentarius]
MLDKLILVAIWIGSKDWIKGFDSKTGAGAEAKGYSYGNSITGSTAVSDSSYTLKWDPTTLESGKTAHFGSTMGVTASPYALPVVSKTYTNETDSSGTNNIGDKLKFSLKVRNNGYGSSWTYEKLKDTIPDGLQIDPNSIVLTYNNGTYTSINASDYDASTKTLTIPPTLSLTDGQEATI